MSPPSRPCFRLPAAVLAAAVAVVVLGSVAGAQPEGALVEVTEVAGLLDPVMADHVSEVLDRAHRDGAEVVVLQLDSVGGLRGAGGAMAQAVRDAPVPVVVWVGPSGAVALGAAAEVVQAADVAALAPLAAVTTEPSSSLGAGPAEPVAIALPAGEALPEGLDLPAGLSASQLVALRPDGLVAAGVADLVAPTLPEVLAELDGRAVRAGEDTLRVDPAAARVRFHNLGLLRRILHTSATPTLTYLLLITGLLALAFEVFQPGFGVAGVSGVILLAPAVYGVWALPVRWLALVVLLVGFSLFALDLALAKLGVLTVGATAAVAAGSWWLFAGPPLLRLSPWLIGIAVAGTIVFFVVVMTVVLRAQAGQPAAVSDDLVGQVGVVRSMLNPEGHVFVAGALWRASAPPGAGKVPTGRRVRVTGFNAESVLEVDPVTEPAEP